MKDFRFEYNHQFSVPGFLCLGFWPFSSFVLKKSLKLVHMVCGLAQLHTQLHAGYFIFPCINSLHMLFVRFVELR